MAITVAVHAGQLGSTSYTIIADTTDSGGAKASSTAYSNVGSAGGIAGVSTAAAPAETAKSGYLGQLYDVIGLTLTAATLNVNETATDQLGAWQLLDDTSLLAVSATSVTWSVVSGPITGISPAGLATAGPVYQNTTANVQGSFGGFSGMLNLTVVDSIPDNFGSYAGDGIDDAWQVQYFGLPPNANAGPTADADGTGQTNLFKYIAGLNPLDPASRFVLEIQPIPGQPSQMNLIFSPLVSGRTYTITATSSLSADAHWSAINASAPTDSGDQRTITDLDATGPEKFYRVEITNP